MDMSKAECVGKIDKRNVDCHRYRMVLAYEGAGFHGWQKQTNAGVPLRTVEKVRVRVRVRVRDRVRIGLGLGPCDPAT